MPNEKITDMTALDPMVDADLLAVVDVSEPSTEDQNKKITRAVFFSSGDETLCKVWLRYQGVTNVITGSFNVSSVTDAGTGTYTINFTNDLADANYAAATAVITEGGFADDSCHTQVFAAGSLGIDVSDPGVATIDLTVVNVIIFGN